MYDKKFNLAAMKMAMAKRFKKLIFPRFPSFFLPFGQNSSLLLHLYITLCYGLSELLSKIAVQFQLLALMNYAQFFFFYGCSYVCND